MLDLVQIKARGKVIDLSELTRSSEDLLYATCDVAGVTVIKISSVQFVAQSLV